MVKSQSGLKHSLGTVTGESWNELSLPIAGVCTSTEPPGPKTTVVMDPPASC